MLSINFMRRARKVLFNPALRKYFSVGCNPKEQTTVQKLTNRQTTKKLMTTLCLRGSPREKAGRSANLGWSALRFCTFYRSGDPQTLCVG